MCNYGAAQAGIVGLTRSVARDMGKYGVTCNAYHPLASTRRTRPDDPDDPLAVFRKRYELGLITKEEYEFLTHLPPPEAVGPLVAYLATDEASDINGQVFYVAGGDIAIYPEPVKQKTIRKDKDFWTVEELIRLHREYYCEGYKNPAPIDRE